MSDRPEPKIANGSTSREAQASAYQPDRASTREMTPAEQARDYERVNGAYNRARAEEVRRYGPGGYKGDPGTDAAERRAEVMGDATMQSLGAPIGNAAAAEIARDLANARVERVLAKYDKPHADEHKDKALQHLADAREATARQNSASDYWAAKIAAAPAQPTGGQAETQRADVRRGMVAKG